MACGTPGVAYNTGAFPEIIDTEIDGFMCSKNPKELAQTIKKALDSDLDKMGKKARKKVLKKFSLEVMYNQTIKSYKKVSGRR
jgi:glycosyltransferase involved in cell wall biosynthesis